MTTSYIYCFEVNSQGSHTHTRLPTIKGFLPIRGAKFYIGEQRDSGVIEKHNILYGDKCGHT